MDSYNVAKWLSCESSDEEFAEVFAYLYKFMVANPGKEPKERLLKEDMYFNQTALAEKIMTCLTEIIDADSECDEGAWWKQ
jgi:hypothetical protein